MDPIAIGIFIATALVLFILGMTLWQVVRDHIEDKVWNDAWQDGYNVGKAENEPPF